MAAKASFYSFVVLATIAKAAFADPTCSYGPLIVGRSLALVVWPRAVCDAVGRECTYSANSMLIATADLLKSVGLLTTLLNSQQEKLDYELNAKLDIGRFLSRIHVVEKGEIPLPGLRSKDSG